MNFRRTRKLIIVYINLLFFALLTGCSPLSKDLNDANKNGSIKLANLSDKESRLLSAVGIEGNLLSYDLELPKGIDSYLGVWVEYYEAGEYKGKLVDTRFHITSTDTKAQLIITKRDSAIEDIEEWIFSIIQSSAVTSFKEMVKKADKNNLGSSTETELFAKTDLTKEPLTLAIQAYGAEFRSKSDVFTTEEYKEQLFQSDFLYVYKAQLKDSLD